MRRLLGLGVEMVVLAAVWCGCGPAPAKSERGASAPAAPRVFEVRGVVLGLEPAERTVRIRHEAVPGYMAAMTMPFEVKDTNELATIAVGDVVTFRMWVTEKEGWIDRLRKVGVDVSVLPREREPVRRVRLVEPLASGDEVPAYTLTNQLGRTFSLHDFRGSVLGLTFIFTRCPYPNFCRRQNTQFAQVADRLATTPGGPTNWSLLTVSFDPEYDTPAVLKEQAEALGSDPAHWSFATASQMDIDAMTEQFGVVVGRDGALFSHNVRTVVIDPRGKVHTVLQGNKWTVDEMAAAMRSAASMR
jgi:protein SCO1/2